MSPAVREIFIDLDVELRIRFRRTDQPLPISYAITLELLSEGEWTTVRLWDNADDVDEHHEHRYTRSGGKQKPVVHDFASTNAAMAAAVEKAKLDAEEIVRQWRTS